MLVLMGLGGLAIGLAIGFQDEIALWLKRF